jgi:hypothetical protein
LISGAYGFACFVDGPAYTLQPGNSSYEVIANQTTRDGVNAVVLPQSSAGYWVHFEQPTALSGLGLPRALPPPDTVPIPAGQYVMIGCPAGYACSVSGADVIYVYDPATGYRQTERVDRGQGAFAYSATEGTLTLTSLCC